MASDGTYTYVVDNSNATVQALGSGGSVKDSFNYTVKNAQGLTDIAVLEVTVNGANDAPTNLVTTNVSLTEDKLPNGILDTGNTLTEKATGTFTFSDVDSSSGFSFVLTGPTDIKAAGGGLISWTQSGSTLTGTAVVNGVSTEVMTVSVGVVSQVSPGNYTATYTATLKAAIEHTSGGGANTKDLVFSAATSDGSATSSNATFTVTVHDDVPLVAQGTQPAPFKPIDTNLLIILDKSMSMGGGAGSAWDTSLNAVNKLMTEYAKLGNVKVQIVMFDATAKLASSEAPYGGNWMTTAQAADSLLYFTPGGETNYDIALYTAMQAFAAAGKIAGAQNVSYFITDGTPSEGAYDSNNPLPDNAELGPQTGSVAGDVGIQPAEGKIWTDFLVANSIRSLALGIVNGSDAPTLTDVNPIAYNGVAPVGNLDGQVVSNVNQLESILLGTVPVPTTQSNLLTGTLGSSSAGFGADGGYVTELTLDGVTYTYNSTTGTYNVSGGSSRVTDYDATTHVITISTVAGGVLVLDFDDGAYTYKTKPGTTTDYTETVGYKLTDRDGDVASGTQILDIYKLDAVNDAILTNDKTGTVNIPTAVLLANDLWRGGETVNAPTNAVGGTVSGTSPSYAFTFASTPVNGSTGSFNYSLTQGSVTDLGVVGLTVVDNATITGTANADILLGKNGVNNTLNGGGGNDVLQGGSGNDTINGGAGTDIISFANGTAGIDVTLSQGAGPFTANVTAAGLGTDTYSNIEGMLGTRFNDTLTGSASADILMGNDGNDVLKGLAGNDTILGGNGNDTLVGGLGNDKLTGGQGADVLVFAESGTTNFDTITDFTPNVDKIHLDNAHFTKLLDGGGAGAVLPASQFLAGAAAAGSAPTPTSATHYVLYNTTSGELFYDADGNGSGAAVLVAKLNLNPALTAGDIFVI